MPSPYVPNPLPLPLFNRLGAASANMLPMVFKRRLGTVPTADGEKQVKVSQAFYGMYTGTNKQQLCLSAMNTVRVDLLDLSVLWSAANQETGCYKATTIGMYDLVNCDRGQVGIGPDLSGAFDVYNSVEAALKQCDTPRYIESEQVSENSHIRMSFGNDIKACVKQNHSAVTAYQEVLLATYENGRDVTGCRSLKASAVRDIPCEYYPVPIPPKPVDPTIRPCPRFPSHRLPLQIRRRRIEYDAAMLPLPFQCPAIDRAIVISGV